MRRDQTLDWRRGGIINKDIQELLVHLRKEAPHGLPLKWFSEARVEIKKDVIPGMGNGEEVMLGTISDNCNEKRILEGEFVGSEVSNLNWQRLEEMCNGCKKCRLCEGRNKVVFGVGKREQPLICFVGEGPGAEEDKQGEPFVGRAGMLLTAAITKGMGLKREDVYICNVVKCRPPENRAPLPDETEACTPYLYRQIELLQPKVIITLGQPAQLALSGVKLGITKLRGQWQEWRGFSLMPTFHPAYLLRNPPAKKYFWEDLKSVMAFLGLKSEGII